MPNANSERELEGLRLALGHAIDMNRNGKLADAKLAEFRKYVSEKALEEETMDEFVKRRDDGVLDKMHEAIGYPDGVDPYDGKKNRETILREVVGDYWTNMWQDGHVNDKDYAGAMRRLGALPEDIINERERSALDGGDGPSDEDEALAAWDARNGGEETAAAAPAGDGPVEVTEAEAREIVGTKTDG